MIIAPEEINKLNLSFEVGLTSGCFDLVHYYHLHYLKRCKAQCDFLIVGVDSDALLKHFKAKDAVIPDYHRVAMVEALKCVDAVFLMDNLRQFKYAAQYAKKVFKNNGELYGSKVIGTEKLVVIPDVDAVLQSTTEIVNKIRKDAKIPS